MNKTLYVFDMDDVLFKTKPFAYYVDLFEESNIIDTDGKFSDYFNRIKEIFIKDFNIVVEFKKLGDYVIIYDSKTNIPLSADLFLPELLKSNKQKRYFGKVMSYLELKSYPGFHSNPETLGCDLNSVVTEQYKKFDNCMVLTGRQEGLRKFIEEVFLKTELPFPSYGLKLYPGTPNIMEFKANTIIQNIIENKWDEVHFYEDRKEWLDFSEQKVIEKFPYIKFVPHYITNIKEDRKMI